MISASVTFDPAAAVTCSLAANLLSFCAVAAANRCAALTGCVTMTSVSSSSVRLTLVLPSGRNATSPTRFGPAAVIARSDVRYARSLCSTTVVTSTNRMAKGGEYEGLHTSLYGAKLLDSVTLKFHSDSIEARMADTCALR